MDRDAIAATFGPAAAEAVRAFPVEPSAIELVTMSENVTFRVDDPRGDRYVLRLHRPGYHTIEELDSEAIWLDALRADGVAVPHPIATEDGRHYVAVEVESEGGMRYAGMAGWQEGEAVDDVLERDGEAAPVGRYFTGLGAIMAAMHNQADGWQPPPSFRRHRLDTEGLLGEAPFWGRFWEHPDLRAADRQQIVATRDELRAALDRYGRDSSTFSVIHADLHHGNLLTNGDDVSVIDFDDAGFGWHQYDLAVALFHLRDTPIGEVAERALLSGYRSVRALSDDAFALVPMFELIRGMALIGWKHQRPEVTWPDGYFEEMVAGVVATCRSFEPPC